ncbi:DUF1304 family protein [Streptomyces filipinensis]|uniref:DUF1304 family protein n=1 Tax=Streptomyces filipinensis TaxID=66887 RepID=UPI0036EBCCBA
MVLPIAALHVYILVLEMFLWTGPRARAALGTSAWRWRWPPARPSRPTSHRRTGRREISVGRQPSRLLRQLEGGRPGRTTEWTGMRATKHAAPQPWRRRGLVTGIPLGLLVAGRRAADRRPVRPALTSLLVSLDRPATERDRRSDPGLRAVRLRPHC